MKSYTNKLFWQHFDDLPEHIKRQARRAYQRFKEDPYHKSLQFKRLKEKEQLYSVRIGRTYRALGLMKADLEIVWFWIGTHAEYDKLISHF